MTDETRDDIRSMMEDTIKELEGKDTSVVEAAAKLEPAKEESVKEEQTKEEVKKEPAEEEGKEVVKEEETTKEPVKDETKEPLLNQDKAPSAWAPSSREKWATIPEDIRQEILKREEASAQGVRKLNEEVAPMREFVHQLTPFIKEAYENGQNPAGYIGQVMAAERALRNPDQNQKFAALLQIADSYGIPLREVINESVGREVLSKPSQAKAEIPDEVKRELEESRKFREEQSQRENQKVIDDFKRDHEFFDDVAHIMANLLETGTAKDLKDAYEQAIWAVPGVRSVLLERQGKENQKNSLADRQKAAASASVKSNETINVKTGSEGDSLEDDIRSSFAEHSGRN